MGATTTSLGSSVNNLTTAATSSLSGSTSDVAADANTQKIEQINAQSGANALAIAQSNARMQEQQAMGDTIKNGASAMKDAAKAS